MKYKHLAHNLCECHDQFGAGLIWIENGIRALEDVGDLELRVRQEAHIVGISDSHLTPKAARKALWELRREREWNGAYSVLFSSPGDELIHVGLGVLVPKDTPLPALSKMEVYRG